MTPCIRLYSLSPVSKYNFEDDDNVEYILTIIKTTDSDVLVYTHILNKLSNITDKVRGFIINLCVPYVTLSYTNMFSVKIFRHKKWQKQLDLLFSGDIDADKLYQTRDRLAIKLFPPPTVNGELRKCVYDKFDAKLFLKEYFHNFIFHDQKNYCLLVYDKIENKSSKLLIPQKVSYLAKNGHYNSTFIFNRYNKNIMCEFMPPRVITQIKKLKDRPSVVFKQFMNTVDFLVNYCKNNNNYEKYIGDYKIDKNIFTDNKLFSKIKVKYRPLTEDPYKNNLMLAPVDGRCRAFKINPTLKFTIYNKFKHINDFVSHPKQILNGSGFITRLVPQDYQGITIPYSGYLREIGLFKANNSGNLCANMNNDPCIISLKIETNYFMPPGVDERNYMAVIYGNNIHQGTGVGAGLRAYPELLNKQPNTKLIYHLVIVGSALDNSIKFTSQKLLHLNKIKKESKHNYTKINPLWLQQGEEIGQMQCGGSYVILLCNRQIEFADDVTHFSRNKISTLVRCRDFIGEIH